jgi:Met-zincin/Domain of unknown function (DUF5117)
MKRLSQFLRQSLNQFLRQFLRKPLIWISTFILGLTIAFIPWIGQLPALGQAKEQAQSAIETVKSAVQNTLSRPLPKATPAPQPKANTQLLPSSSTKAPDTTGKSTKGEGESGSSFPPFDRVIKDTKQIDGLFKLYRNEKNGRLLAEIRPDQFNRNFLAAMTLESGIGQNGLYSGLPLGDFIFTLRRVNNTLQFVVPNTYFRATSGTPSQRSVQRSFSDSVLEALPIRTLNPANQAVLVELNPLFLGDLPGLTPILAAVLGSPYTIDQNRTYFDNVKGFPENLEIESVYGYAGGSSGDSDLPSFISALPDSRAFDLRLRYSLSTLPERNGYRPRMADDRIGYFLTAYQDFTDDTPRLPYVRYINRWHLEKKEPTVSLSEPKKPIKFWLENTIPLEYRDAVREGVLMWNQAFEKIGFKDAIVVEQMPDKADWDPADIRYNTIRWFNSKDASFALGPSRVNPFTGEILDADILVDANFLRSLKQEFRSLIEQNQEKDIPFVAQLTGNANLCNYGMAGRTLKQRSRQQIQQKRLPRLRFASHNLGYQDLCFGLEGTQQFAMGDLSMKLMQNQPPSSSEMKRYIDEFLRELISHEVGHTLGLRHNFYASAMLKPEELNNPEITRKRGLIGSVMDYAAVNLAPQGTPQGDYFTHVIGPYDEWAIAYGYSVNDTKTIVAERDLLSKIASRAPEPGLAYATDEDVLSGLNPKVNLFDLSSDLLTYSQWQMENARAMWQRIDKRLPLQGESFNDVRVAFNAVFGYYFQNATLLTNYIGGQYFNRFRYGDAQGRFPFESVSLADQRKALEVISQNVFTERAFQFSPTLLNKLAPSRWSHWGTNPALFKLDYPILDNVLFLQMVTMYDLLSSDRLSRLRDGELKNPAETLSIPELMNRIQSSIWGEIVQPEGTIKLNSLRRALQREHMNLLVNIVLRRDPVPEDAQTVARFELKQLRDAIAKASKKVDEKDIYTLAHLEESRDRITKTLEAPLQAL